MCKRDCPVVLFTDSPLSFNELLEAVPAAAPTPVPAGEDAAPPARPPTHVITRLGQRLPVVRTRHANVACHSPEGIQARVAATLRLRCPVCAKQYEKLGGDAAVADGAAREPQTFRRLADLHNHMRRQHKGLHVCDLCARHATVFSCDLPTYTKKELELHCDGKPVIRRGAATDDEDDDADDNVRNEGHPRCRWCRNTRLYDDDELRGHYGSAHAQCPLCASAGPVSSAASGAQRGSPGRRHGGGHGGRSGRGGRRGGSAEADGVSASYHRDFDALRRHCRNSHFLCQEAECGHGLAVYVSNARVGCVRCPRGSWSCCGVRFGTRRELQAHALASHGATMTADERAATSSQLVSFTFHSSGIDLPSGPQRRGRGRGTTQDARHGGSGGGSGTRGRGNRGRGGRADGRRRDRDRGALPAAGNVLPELKAATVAAVRSFQRAGVIIPVSLLHATPDAGIVGGCGVGQPSRTHGGNAVHRNNVVMNELRRCIADHKQRQLQHSPGDDAASGAAIEAALSEVRQCAARFLQYASPDGGVGAAASKAAAGMTADAYLDAFESVCGRDGVESVFARLVSLVPAAGFGGDVSHWYSASTPVADLARVIGSTSATGDASGPAGIYVDPASIAMPQLQLFAAFRRRAWRVVVRQWCARVGDSRGDASASVPATFRPFKEYCLDPMFAHRDDAGVQRAATQGALWMALQVASAVSLHCARAMVRTSRAHDAAGTNAVRHDVINEVRAVPSREHFDLPY